jgi:hypothetical protein
LYYSFERIFPDSSLFKIFLAQFLMTFRNREEALSKLDQASKLKPKIDEEFIIYKSRHTASKDAITLITFNSYLDAAFQEENKALKSWY